MYWGKCLSPRPLNFWRKCCQLSNMRLVLFLSLVLACFAVWRKEEFYTAYLKTYNCIVFTKFQHTKLNSFQNHRLRFIPKIFPKFRKCKPRYFYVKTLWLHWLLCRRFDIPRVVLQSVPDCILFYYQTKKKEHYNRNFSRARCPISFLRRTLSVKCITIVIVS